MLDSETLQVVSRSDLNMRRLSPASEHEVKVLQVSWWLIVASPGHPGPDSQPLEKRRAMSRRLIKALGSGPPSAKSSGRERLDDLFHIGAADGRKPGVRPGIRRRDVGSGKSAPDAVFRKWGKKTPKGKKEHPGRFLTRPWAAGLAMLHEVLGARD